MPKSAKPIPAWERRKRAKKVLIVLQPAAKARVDEMAEEAGLSRSAMISSLIGQTPRKSHRAIQCDPPMESPAPPSQCTDPPRG